MIEDLGLKIHCNARATEFTGDEEGKVSGMKFSNEGWEDLPVGMVVVSAGIRCATSWVRVRASVDICSKSSSSSSDRSGPKGCLGLLKRQ